MVIPTTLRKRMIQILHTRGTMYWPNKNTDIENMIANCTECEIYCNKLEKETLLQHNVPEMPLPKVATDLFHCFNQNYFILLDYTSIYFEVCQLQNLTREKVITKMKSSCSRFGVREEIVSDNGSQYTSREFREFAKIYNFRHTEFREFAKIYNFRHTEFREFAKIYNFRHTKSTPEYPQSNGLAERTIQKVKKKLKKSQTLLGRFILSITNPKINTKS